MRLAAGRDQNSSQSSSGEAAAAQHRYLSAQMEGYLADDLWRALATQANARARQLAAGIAALPGARLVHPTEANAVFAAWPRAGHRAARAAGAQYYLWPGHQSLDGPGDEPLSARLVCNWSTTEGDVEAFLQVLGARTPAAEAAGLQG